MVRSLDELRMIGKNLGRYSISEKLGAGGVGEVYRARDERLERDVAVKLLSSKALTDDTSRKRFRKEALVLSKLNHPNIATILDFDTQEDVDFLVMEYITGQTLATRLERGAMSEKDILYFAVQIAAAMEEAHAMGVVHRDLKPANIFVTPKGQIKVLDFGLAKLLQPVTHDMVTRATTETNLIVGTLPYMSPEQLRSDPVDARTDIYSFGVVLYEMSTGQLPHQGTQPITLADAILNKLPSPPGQLRPNLSPRFQEIVLKCLEKDPENRYQSVKELLVDLRRLAAPTTMTSFSDDFIPEKQSFWKKKTILIALFSILAITVIAAAIKFARWPGAAESAKSYPEIQSIVALPSRIYGLENDQFLSEAIPNAISTHLSQIADIETKVPPTENDLENLKGDLSKIGTVYGVNALIISSVAAKSGNFTLNVQLVEANSRRLLWSRDFEGSRDNYLELVRTASDGLRAALRPSGAPIKIAPDVAPNTNAELAFQRGFYHLRSYANLKQQQDYDAALAGLNEALDLDPNNARAAAAIARLNVARIESGAPLREVLPQVDEWAYRALQLDYRCGEAWTVLSVAEEMRPGGDHRKSLGYALKAATYSSKLGYSHHVLATALFRTSFVLSLKAAEEGMRQDPLHLNGLLFAAGVLSREGKAKEALALIDQVLNVEPDMPVAIVMKEWLLLRDHRYQEAEKLRDTLNALVAQKRLHPGWVEFAQIWLEFEKSASAGKKDQAAAAMEQLVIHARGQAPPFPRWEAVTGNVVAIQAQNDSVDRTIETLAIRASKGINEPYDWLLLSPELQPLRSDPRLKELAVDSKAKFQQMLAILEEARGRNELPSYLEQPLAQVRPLQQ